MNILFFQDLSTLRKLIWLKTITGTVGEIWETISGAVCTFTTRRAAPVRNMTVQIVPVQSGSGDPAPDNVRPISGWTGATLLRTGKNLFNGSYTSGTITMLNNVYSVTNLDGRLAIIPCKPNTQYTIKKWDESNRFIICTAAEYPSAGTALTLCANEPASSEKTFTTASNAAYIVVFVSTSAAKEEPAMQVELGSAATAYETYQGAVYTISWQTEAGTVYGGTLDVTTGLLSVCPYYASYEGEALVGPWISSMDVYAPGVTPATGAQVLDLGGAHSTYQLTPTEVTTLLGDNSIWADTGDVSLEYRAD